MSSFLKFASSFLIVLFLTIGLTFGQENQINNILVGRYLVIGWGGKKPIYDEMDKLAVKNVRVEIEIMQNFLMILFKVC